MAKRVSLRAYRLGCRLLDRDHEVLLRIMDRMGTAIREHQHRTLKGLMIALDAYFDAHFESEDDLMRAWDYPAHKEHAQEHEVMRARVHGLVASIRSCRTDLAQAALSMLQEWTCTHISETDRPLAQHLNRCGAARKMASCLHRAEPERVPACELD
jgi:hemerythrin-like metal-binding protein